jgi:hypothetical protein
MNVTFTFKIELSIALRIYIACVMTMS